MTVEKLIFVWEGYRALPAPPDRLTFRPLTTADDIEFSRLVESALVGTLDRLDRHSLTSMSIPSLAERYLHPDASHFTYQPDWWQVAYDSTGAPIGFLQPVTYRGSERAGLSEGTIHLVGVKPEHRGRGYIHDLLRQATAILLNVGVWRIYCDTDRENDPMVRAFQAAGYQMQGVRQVSSPLLDAEESPA